MTYSCKKFTLIKMETFTIHLNVNNKSIYNANNGFNILIYWNNIQNSNKSVKTNKQLTVAVTSSHSLKLKSPSSLVHY